MGHSLRRVHVLDHLFGDVDTQATRLAAAWNGPESRDECLEHLLNDRRRGRRGFPPDVERELVTLRRYARSLPR